MKTSKNTIVEPELFVDDHHGQYMGELAYEYLNARYKAQVKKQLSDFDIEAIQDTDSEFYYDAVNNFTNVVFKTNTGQKFNIQFAEGGLWIIPFCFMRSKKANEFFGY